MQHMAKIGVRDLRQNAGAYLNRVQEGEVIEVSMRGRLVARIVPVVESEWDGLVSEGHIRPAAEGALLQDIEPLKSDSATTAFEALRGVREYGR